MVNIVQDYIPQGRRNRPAGVNPCEYVTIHNTGNTKASANAARHAEYVKSDAAAQAPVSWHYTVDESGAYQHLPDNETAYHAGDGEGYGNTRSIGVEICMNSDGDLLAATNNAVELTAALCARHGIPAENIKQHCDWSGKNCPQMLRAGKPYDWNTFIGRVRGLMDTAPAAVRFKLDGVIINATGELTGGKVYTSARELLEALGYSVAWEPATRTVIIAR